MARKPPLYPHVPKRKVERLPQTERKVEGVYKDLIYAAVDEHHAYLLYSRLADELEAIGLHTSADRLKEMASDEKRHDSTLQEILREIRGLGGSIRASR